MYYRVAIQMDTSQIWKWKSSALGSLDTLLLWLRHYRVLPRDCLRIFSASSLEDLSEQLTRENQGLRSNSVPATQFLQERLIHYPEVTQGASEPERDKVADRRWQPSMMEAIAARSHPPAKEDGREGNGLIGADMSTLERRRLELELGPGGDHAVSYRFALPGSTPQVLAWMGLLGRIARGELQP